MTHAIQLDFSPNVNNALKALNFCSGSVSVPLSSASGSQLFIGGGYNLGWTVGAPVGVRLASNCAQDLSVDATPPCGSSVPGISMQPTYSLALEPAPAAETETEYRWVTDSTEGNWLGSQLIGTSGRSSEKPRDAQFAQWRNAYAGFRGFEFRLKDTHSVTKQCTWTFTEDPASPRTPPNTGGTGTGGGGGVSTPTPTPTPPPTEQPSSPRCGESDTEDLERFYEATEGERWDDNENWNSQEPLDQWFGVDTDEDGEVVSLRLADNGLSGDMPTEELLCLAELKELALWDNEDLSGDVPDELVRAVERAILREIAETLDLNTEWFDDYEDPFSFEDWHSGVTTDEDGRVVELALPGEIPRSLSGQLKKLREIVITTSSSGGGCAVGASSERAGASALLAAVLMLLAVSRGLRARSY